MSDAELKRLKDAFKRVPTVNGFMSENVFMREVLWDGVPPKIAQVFVNPFFVCFHENTCVLSSHISCLTVIYNSMWGLISLKPSNFFLPRGSTSLKKCIVIFHAVQPHS